MGGRLRTAMAGSWVYSPRVFGTCGPSSPSCSSKINAARGPMASPSSVRIAVVGDVVSCLPPLPFSLSLPDSRLSVSVWYGFEVVRYNPIDWGALGCGEVSCYEFFALAEQFRLKLHFADWWSIHCQDRLWVLIISNDCLLYELNYIEARSVESWRRY